MQPTNDVKELRAVMSALISRMGALEESVFSCCSITLTQAQTLVEIGHAGSISLVDLSALLNLDNSTMSRTVNNLVTKGLCARDEDPQDRRYVVIRLTKDGCSMYETIEQCMDEYYGALFAALPEGKRTQVLESCRLLLEATKDGSICGQGCCQ